MNNNLLLIVENKEDIDFYKSKKISNFLYPLKDYSVGFNNYFSLHEIKEENSFILVNEVMDTKKIESFKEVLPKLNKNIKGIIFEDVGLINLLEGSNLFKILNIRHFHTNTSSINNFLDYVDSLVISNDIPLSDIKDILNKSKKSLCLYALGYLDISYSKRTLIKNYKTNYNLDVENNLVANNNLLDILVNENNDGTVIYKNKLFNAFSEYTKLKSVKYILLNSFNLTKEDVLENITKNSKDHYKAYLNKKTIYKLEGKND